MPYRKLMHAVHDTVSRHGAATLLCRKVAVTFVVDVFVMSARWHRLLCEPNESKNRRTPVLSSRAE